MELGVKTFEGSAIQPFISALASLRIRVFREWPYLYDGDPQYENNYLQTYLNSESAMLAIAFDDQQIIGCATAIKLIDESDECRAPFLAAGLDASKVVYFGESVLDEAYRGKGLGHLFFDHREAFARQLTGIHTTAFCAVERSIHDSRRPSDARDLANFWRSRGYVRHPALHTQFVWKEINETNPTSQSMCFWLRHLD
jgi:GNAT superfamily N-acetyltransferase